MRSDPLDVEAAVTNAVDAIEALNDVISGDSTDSIRMRGATGLLPMTPSMGCWLWPC